MAKSNSDSNGLRQDQPECSRTQQGSGGVAGYTQKGVFLTLRMDFGSAHPTG
jgi:hypothetical protein